MRKSISADDRIVARLGFLAEGRLLVTILASTKSKLSFSCTVFHNSTSFISSMSFLCLFDNASLRTFHKHGRLQYLSMNSRINSGDILLMFWDLSHCKKYKINAYDWCTASHPYTQTSCALPHVPLPVDDWGQWCQSSSGLLRPYTQTTGVNGTSPLLA